MLGLWALIHLPCTHSTNSYRSCIFGDAIGKVTNVDKSDPYLPDPYFIESMAGAVASLDRAGPQEKDRGAMKRL